MIVDRRRLSAAMAEASHLAQAASCVPGVSGLAGDARPTELTAPGVVIGPAIEVRLVLRWGWSAPRVADEVRRRVGALAPGRRVDVHVVDVDADLRA
jgi:hypothetical protein